MGFSHGFSLCGSKSIYLLLRKHIQLPTICYVHHGNDEDFDAQPFLVAKVMTFLLRTRQNGDTSPITIDR